jgi:hypothetical protein
MDWWEYNQVKVILINIIVCFGERFIQIEELSGELRYEVKKVYE